ncbi:MAG TPA: hypothetical protein PLP07_06245 [Pyrinomonadaceae bacterium]|nr:hypothetical protein [Chloracidobacterium sp.]HQX55508.1 hypothetical protein [Pyrinomonadaceae bacterium]HQY67004.1 hypothetical protein [Pyrinomonadaceae bacterium]
MARWRNFTLTWTGSATVRTRLFVALGIKKAQNAFVVTKMDELSLGELKGVFRVRMGLTYFLPHFGLFCVALIGFAIYYGAPAGWKSYVSALVFLLFSLPLAFILWKTIPSLFDQLTVYQNGFTYKTRRGLQSCTWPQIKDQSATLDTGDRMKMTSVEKRGGEMIVFAYKMRGLDLLDHLYAEYEFDKIPQAEKATSADLADEPTSLGELKGTFRVGRKAFDFVPLALVALIAGFGILLTAVNLAVVTFFVCTVPLMIPFLIIARTMIIERRDVMQIYENGFKYFDKKSETSCLWSEIADYNIARGPFGGIEGLTGIKKNDGNWVAIAGNMQGLDKLAPHLRKTLTWNGTE